MPMFYGDRVPEGLNYYKYDYKNPIAGDSNNYKFLDKLKNDDASWGNIGDTSSIFNETNTSKSEYHNPLAGYPDNQSFTDNQCTSNTCWSPSDNLPKGQSNTDFLKAISDNPCW